MLQQRQIVKPVDNKTDTGEPIYEISYQIFSFYSLDGDIYQRYHIQD